METSAIMDAALAVEGPFELDSAAPIAARRTGLWRRCRQAADTVTSLRREWGDLAEAAAEPNAFSEHWFVAASLPNLAPERDIRMLEVWDGEQLIGLLPLAIGTQYGRIPIRHATNWLHHHSFLGTPLVRAGRERAFWAEALAFLDADRSAPSFLHLVGLVEGGPVHRALKDQNRACDTVLRSERALLDSALSPQDYYEQAVRKKKRKELKRLQNRLAELGEVRVRRLASADDVQGWCDAFLALEGAQWKGEAGTALACRPETERFFRDAVAGARAAGKLEMLRIDLDERPIAMLVNFLSPPGSFSFKIAFDEDYARFSPGVLIQIENLDVLARPDIGWMDSCAIEDHSMINSIWRERRALVRVTVPLAGFRRRALFRLCRTAEDSYSRLKRLRRRPSPLPEHTSDD